jgi:RHS repeat-associated protein
VLAATTAGAFLVVVPFGLGRDRGAASAAIPAGIVYYHTNHLGSTMLANTSGDGVTSLGFENTNYHPYGESTGSAPEFAFTGQRFLAGIGLYHFGARWYDAAMGRFLQPDPLVPEPFNPQSLNRYSYALNDPVNRVDPTGLFSTTSSMTITLPDGTRQIQTVTLSTGDVSFGFTAPGPSRAVNPNLLGDTVGRIITSLAGGLESRIGSFDVAQTAIASQGGNLQVLILNPDPDGGIKSTWGHAATHLATEDEVHSYGSGGWLRVRNLEDYLFRNRSRDVLGLELSLNAQDLATVRSGILADRARDPRYGPLGCNCTDALESGLESIGFKLGVNVTPYGLGEALIRSGRVTGINYYPATAPGAASGGGIVGDLRALWGSRQ